MKKTEQLLAAMTTGVLLTGTPASASHAFTAAHQVSRSADESWKTDPKVGTASDKVMTNIQGRYVDSAQTEEDLQTSNPTMDAALLRKALLRLVWQNRIHRDGDGTPDPPYRYFELTRHGG